MAQRGSYFTFSSSGARGSQANNRQTDGPGYPPAQGFSKSTSQAREMEARSRGVYGRRQGNINVITGSGAGDQGFVSSISYTKGRV